MPSYKCKCGAKYKLPETSIGKKAKCKHCNLVFVVKDDKQAAPKQIESDPNDLFADIEAAVSRSKTETATERVTVDPYAAMTAAYGPAVVTATPSAPSKATKTPSVATGYGHALLRALQFPFSIHNGIVFMIIWFILAVQGTILPRAGCVGLLAIIIISGWYCTFCFDIVGEAAANRDDLPKISFDQGFMDDIIIPFFSWIGSWLVVLAPAIIYLTVKAAGILSDPANASIIASGDFGALADELEDGQVVFYVLFYGGIAMWPMVILCVALGGFSTIGRIDLLMLTIVKTLPVYLLTAGIFLATEYTSGLLQEYLKGTIVMPKAAGATSFMDIFGIVMLWIALARGVELYFTVVALKAIGAYYYYFKDKFAWSWG